MWTKTSDEAWPATMDGGGRDDATVFLVRGRRTGMNKARINFMRVRGCFSRAQFGRRRVRRWRSTVGRLGFLPAAMAAWRSVSWDAGGWRGSSRGASIDWCGAVGAFGGGGTAMCWRVDRRPSGGRAGSSPVLWGTALRCEKTELGGSMSCRESRWCSRSTGSGSGGGVGG
jgi:hypothetical protein